MTQDDLARRVRFGDVLVPYDDATQEIIVERTNVDILLAKPGDDRNCMNSLCIRAQRNSHLFPHPVYAVSTIPTRVYIVDRLDDSGGFAHAVRYELSGKDSHLISDHDKYGSGEPGLLKLRIPRDPKGSPKRAAAKGQRFKDGAGHGDSPGGQYTGQRNRPVTGGAAGVKAGAAKGKARPDGIGAAARYKVAVGGLNL